MSREVPVMQAREGRAQAIAVFGTGSNVGKSVITAGLCRLLWRRGLTVAPFKSQNMSLNSFATAEGGEMGRAQALQAQACHLLPHVDMNPILLKPESDRCAQVIIQGRVWEKLEAGRYLAETLGLFRFVRESYERLARSCQAIVIEGAGSAAEMNLRDRDIANWRVADLADASVVLVADIDQGGVFAQVIGTMDLLNEKERRRVIGIVVNKFRGDRSLFEDGVSILEQRTRIPVLGVIPYLRDLTLDEEDRVDIERTRLASFSSDRVNIAVILLPRMSNFTDFTHLAAEEDVILRYAGSPTELEGADAVMIPGSKNTIADLEYLRASGFGQALKGHVLRGVELIGICGGYQILGKEISDPYKIEAGGAVSGLGFLDVTTQLTSVKITEQVRAIASHVSDTEEEHVTGYYIHMGRTMRWSGPPCFRVVRHEAVERIPVECAGAVNVDEGACQADGSVWGTYIHGVFDQPGFRRAWLNRLRRRKSLEPLPKRNSESVNEQLALELDRWADHVQAHLELGAILASLTDERRVLME